MKVWPISTIDLYGSMLGICGSRIDLHESILIYENLV